jgi:glycerol kinase
MKFQADVLGVPVVVPERRRRPRSAPPTWRASPPGRWSEADVRSMWRQAARYEPSMSADRRESLLEGWRRAVEVTTRERTG